MCTHKILSFLVMLIEIKKILLDRRYDELLYIFSRFVGMTIQ